MTTEREGFIATWAQTAVLSPLDVDCAVTLMLKIIDGKCRMDGPEKAAMAVIYDVVQAWPGERLDPSLRALIEETRHGVPDEAARMAVYEQRLLAETRLSRPVMKAYKARLRAEGVL